MDNQRGWRAFREHLKTPEGGEIRRHALVGGIVATLISLFEALDPHPIETKQSLFLLILLLMGVFVVGFGLLLLIEYRLQRRNPISLDGVGVVDGVWVYGFREVNGEDRRFNAGSIVRITSTGLGFALSGHAYRLKDLEDPELLDRNGQMGFFNANGQAKSNMVSFHYWGSEGNRQGSGVGRYLFTKGFAEEGDYRLSGEFTGDGLDGTKSITSREVKGRKISAEVPDKFDGTSERAALLVYLRKLNSTPDEVKISFPSAGVIDGWWVDAVYEERGVQWQPVKGSIMQFETVEASGRFTVRGDTYELEDLDEARDPAEVQPNYNFVGHGRRMETVRAEGFYFEYYGKEGGDARGAGYYEFFKSVGEAPTFDGSFLCSPLGQPHAIVYGRKISDDAELKDRRRELHEHLKRCVDNPPPMIKKANQFQSAPEQRRSATSS